MSVLHREHRTPPSHFKCLLRHGTHATATEALVWSLFDCFWLFFWPVPLLPPLSDWGVCAGGVPPLMLLWVVILCVGDRWSPNEGDNGDVESGEKSWWPPQ